MRGRRRLRRTIVSSDFLAVRFRFDLPAVRLARVCTQAGASTIFKNFLGDLTRYAMESGLNGFVAQDKLLEKTDWDEF